MSLLNGRVVLITGASRGIGSAIAKLFARHDASVVINGRDDSALNEVRDEIRKLGAKVMCVNADVTDYEQVQKMRVAIEQKMGPVDTVVANVGGDYMISGPFENISEDEWNTLVNGNLTSTFITIKSFLPGMKQRKTGNIITISSGAGRRVNPKTSAPYSAAKAGVQMMTQFLAAEVGQFGIRVNCIAPGMIITKRSMKHISEKQIKVIAEQYPLRRLGTPEDIAEAALFLASDQSSWITGVVLDVAGGSVLV